MQLLVSFFKVVSRHVQTDGPPRAEIRRRSGFFWCFDDNKKN